MLSFLIFVVSVCHVALCARIAFSFNDRFSFYQRWFDTMFLLSGCVTAVTLLSFHLANRNSDADHHEENHDVISGSSSSNRSERTIATTATDRRDMEPFGGAWGWDRSSSSSTSAGTGAVDPNVDRHGTSGRWYYSNGDLSGEIRTRGRGAVGQRDSDAEKKKMFSSSRGCDDGLFSDTREPAGRRSAVKQS